MAMSHAGFRRLRVEQSLEVQFDKLDDFFMILLEILGALAPELPRRWRPQRHGGHFSETQRHLPQQPRLPATMGAVAIRASQATMDGAHISVPQVRSTMRILYGVVGEGMGHATRSRVVISHLLQAGHTVHVLVSGRAHDMLSKHFQGVHRVHGWHLVYDDNEVQKRRTAWSNLTELVHDAPMLANAWRQLEDFRPEVVVSDFESWTYAYAQAHHIPVISVDNMQIINRCKHEDALLVDRMAEFLLAKGIVKTKLPGAYHYVVTTFFYPPVRKERTTLVPPILRPEVLAAHASRGDAVVVYSSADGGDALPNLLKQFPNQRFLLYGIRRGLSEVQVDGNLAYQPFSETGFIDHLAAAKAVIAGGGFSLLSEAVYLHKPVLSVPLVGQFEQILNARYLQHLGWGLCRETVTKQDVAELLDRSSALAAAMDSYEQDGNRVLFDTLDGLLQQAVG